MEQYIQKAIKLGIDIYGFSDHAPMDFEPEYRMSLGQSKQYENDILKLKYRYKDQIDIRLAYEVDYMRDSKYMEKDILEANVDYLIGSVHFLDDWGFDNPAFLKTYEKKDIDQIWEEYFDTVTSMVKTGYFDIVGHLDLIKVFKYLPTKNIIDISYDCLRAIKDSNMSIEINSAGIRKPINEVYPSRVLLEQAYKLNIPITFGSDAHSVDQVGFGYEEALLLAKQIGYKQCAVYKNKQLQMVQI
jgi:histidinol-phosphatase (PHP family)